MLWLAVAPSDLVTEALAKIGRWLSMLEAPEAASLDAGLGGTLDLMRRVEGGLGQISTEEVLEARAQIDALVHTLTELAQVLETIRQAKGRIDG